MTHEDASDRAFSRRTLRLLARKGEAGKILQGIVEELKPEAVYFTELRGQRGAILVIDLPSPSDVPRIAEPFFLSFNAECHFKVFMSGEDLAKVGLNELAKRWG